MLVLRNTKAPDVECIGMVVGLPPRLPCGGEPGVLMAANEPICKDLLYQDHRSQGVQEAGGLPPRGHGR
jgi:hypothetical protein